MLYFARCVPETSTVFIHGRVDGQCYFPNVATVTGVGGKNPILHLARPMGVRAVRDIVNLVATVERKRSGVILYARNRNDQFEPLAWFAGPGVAAVMSALLASHRPQNDWWLVSWDDGRAWHSARAGDDVTFDLVPPADRPAEERFLYAAIGAVPKTRAA